MKRQWGLVRVGIFSFLGALLLSIALATPSQAHWADLAVANVDVGKTTTHITLTFPTGLAAFADDDRDGKLAATEVRAHQAELAAFLGDRLRLTDGKGDRGTLTVAPSDTSVLPPDQQVTASTHSTLQLTYTWLKPAEGLTLHYDLFLPGVATARCLTTINAPGQTQSVIFSPESKDVTLMQNAPWYFAGGLPLAIAGCFMWGAMHAMSPGHGKTIVGAYLVGAHATPQHAVFLGLTTTITHTAGVFALGLGTLFFSQYVLPERLYPWLSFISGLIVVDIGLRQLMHRLRQHRLAKKRRCHIITATTSTTIPMTILTIVPIRPYLSTRTKGLRLTTMPTIATIPTQRLILTIIRTIALMRPYTAICIVAVMTIRTIAIMHMIATLTLMIMAMDTFTRICHREAMVPPVTWRSLLALGISGGMVPCPSALVMLLSAIALGRVGFGLLMVVVFSLGLAATLTTLGLLLVSARHLFERMPTQLRIARLLPAVSALAITLLGVGISTQAVMQIGLLKLSF